MLCKHIYLYYGVFLFYGDTNEKELLGFRLVILDINLEWRSVQGTDGKTRGGGQRIMFAVR